MQVSKLSPIAALGISAMLAGCAAMNHRSTTVESGGDVSGGVVTPIDNRAIPMGARLTATLDQTLSTSASKAGDMFTATVSTALRASDGSTVVPEGAKIEGHVTATDASSNPTDPALIRLQFDRIRFNGTSYPFAAAIVESSPEQTSTQSKSDQTKKIVIGGVVGAALGGLLSGGDLDKIVIGGAIGAAAGSVVSMGTAVDAALPAGSLMTVQATQTTTIR